MLAESSGIIRLTHSEAGTLRLAYETLELPADDDQRLIVYLPADAATSAALDRLDSHSSQPAVEALRQTANSRRRRHLRQRSVTVTKPTSR